MKNARLEPTTSLSVLAAHRDTYLRHEGWKPLQNLAGFSSSAIEYLALCDCIKYFVIKIK